MYCYTKEEYYINNIEGNNRGWGLTFTASPATVSIPTGQITITSKGYVNFVVPQRITRVQVKSEGYIFNYVSVTPNSYHRLYVGENSDDNGTVYYLACDTHTTACNNGFSDVGRFTISWSTEINKHAADWWLMQGGYLDTLNSVVVILMTSCSNREVIYELSANCKRSCFELR